MAIDSEPLSTSALTWCEPNAVWTDDITVGLLRLAKVAIMSYRKQEDTHGCQSTCSGPR